MTPRRELLPDTTGKDTQRNSYRLLSHAQDRHRFSEGKADVVSSSLSNHPLAKGKISHLLWCLTGCTNHTPGQSHEQEMWDNTKQKVFLQNFASFCLVAILCPVDMLIVLNAILCFGEHFLCVSWILFLTLLSDLKERKNMNLGKQNRERGSRRIWGKVQ